MEWVKCSKRIPKKNGKYYIRKISSGDKRVSSFSHEQLNSKFYVEPDEFEWLDESNNRIFYTPEIHGLVVKLNSKEITITRFVEILNEMITGLTPSEQLKINYE